MTRELEDCKTSIANQLNAVYTTFHKLNKMADRVDPSERLIVSQSAACMLQSIRQMERALEQYMDKKG